jgi:LmbE family N-acetylglucosaminyl deacetylase
VATLVCFHAHPDDEAILTGGTMARAHDEGHRVILVIATDGAHGEVPDDLGPDETLVERRARELECSARVLGVDEVLWLGYGDSGMNGWAQNDDPSSLHRADLNEAAERLAEMLVQHDADVLTIYDWHGNYGHPDHIMVHRIGVAAAELVADRCVGLRVFEATINRDEMVRMMSEFGGIGPDGESDFDPNGPADDGNPMGMPEAQLTHEIDVSAFLDLKRNALACHRSQVADSSFFLSMDPSAFARAFGREWFIERGADLGDAVAGVRRTWLFEAAALR